MFIWFICNERVFNQKQGRSYKHILFIYEVAHLENPQEKSKSTTRVQGEQKERDPLPEKDTWAESKGKVQQEENIHTSRGLQNMQGISPHHVNLDSAKEKGECCSALYLSCSDWCNTQHMWTPTDKNPATESSVEFSFSLWTGNIIFFNPRTKI